MIILSDSEENMNDHMNHIRLRLHVMINFNQLKQTFISRIIYYLLPCND